MKTKTLINAKGLANSVNSGAIKMANPTKHSVKTKSWALVITIVATTVVAGNLSLMTSMPRLAISSHILIGDTLFIPNAAFSTWNNRNVDTLALAQVNRHLIALIQEDNKAINNASMSVARETLRKLSLTADHSAPLIASHPNTIPIAIPKRAAIVWVKNLITFLLLNIHTRS